MQLIVYCLEMYNIRLINHSQILYSLLIRYEYVLNRSRPFGNAIFEFQYILRESSETSFQENNQNGNYCSGDNDVRDGLSCIIS
ncbi:hypothetical protein PSSHI_46860 [Photobacterium sp. R1]